LNYQELPQSVIQVNKSNEILHCTKYQVALHSLTRSSGLPTLSKQYSDSSTCIERGQHSLTHSLTHTISPVMFS